LFNQEMMGTSVACQRVPWIHFKEGSLPYRGVSYTSCQINTDISILLKKTRIDKCGLNSKSKTSALLCGTPQRLSGSSRRPLPGPAPCLSFRHKLKLRGGKGREGEWWEYFHLRRTRNVMRVQYQELAIDIYRGQKCNYRVESDPINMWCSSPQFGAWVRYSETRGKQIS
jgi:hypothetical protein